MAQPFGISMRVIDAAGATTTQLFFVPSTTLLADVIAVASALSNTYDACLGGRVEDIKVTLPAALGGSVKAAPVANVYLPIGGLMSYDVTGTQYSETVLLPAIREDAITGKDSINPNQTQLAALTTALTAGITVNGNLVQFTDAYGLDILAFRSSKRSKRNK